MVDPREAAKAAEKRIKDDDVIRKVDPTKPHTNDDQSHPAPTPTPTPTPTPPIPGDPPA